MTDPQAPQPAPSNDSEGNQPAGEPSPRAFAQGTGIYLQVVGVLLFLTTCCVCSSAVFWDPVDTAGEMEQKVTVEKQQPIPTLQTMFKDPATAGFSIMIAFSTVGGLAMAVFGLGLQADKPKAAAGAMVSVVVWALVLIGAGVGLWIGDGSIGARLWHLLMMAIALLSLGFTAAAFKQVRKHPPPTEMEVLPADWEPPKRGHH